MRGRPRLAGKGLDIELALFSPISLRDSIAEPLKGFSKRFRCSAVAFVAQL